MESNLLKPAERNAFVAKKLREYIERVQAGQGPSADRYPSERKVLERLVPIETDGFRGITLTAIMGKYVRDDINTGTEFDSIHPRGLFENGIRPVLKEFRIPTSASAPLNVAKNTQVLDEKWAEGRKPEDSALAAVDYIRRINRHWHDPDFREDLVMMFVQRLVAYAAEVSSHDAVLVGLEGAPPLSLAHKLAKFICDFPEGGSIPQFVVGTLLDQLRLNDTDYQFVGGLDASAFGTNTTSNKPADLWEKLADGSLGNLYEVTCKRVDHTRLDAAVDSFAQLELPNMPITFVCRLPDDVASLELENGTIIVRGVTFQFVDISEFVIAIFILLNARKQGEVLSCVANFISDPARKIRTKQGWSKAFA